MEVKIIDDIKKNKIILKKDFNTDVNYVEKPNNNLEYRKNDVVFVERSDDGKLHIVDYLYKYNIPQNGNIFNKSLSVNKFTNIFNLGKGYNMNENENEKVILRGIEESNKKISDTLYKRYYFVSLKVKLKDKLIIGLGNQSVFETGITLHHTYGIPYIPGQAVKGALRNYVIREYFNSLEKDAMANKQFLLIFGGKDEDDSDLNTCGRVIFMDSFPCSCSNFKLEKDVMTPHYGNYYKDDSGNSLPNDSDTPNPIPFLVVEKNGNEDLKFEINIGIDESILNKPWDENNKITIKEFLIDNLVDALDFYGLGAKTSVGYGYFDIDKNEAQQQDKKAESNRKKKLEKEKNLKRKLQAEEKFKKAMEGKSDLEKQVYRFKLMKDDNKKNDAIMGFFSNKIDDLENPDKIVLSMFVMNYLKEKNEWKYKISKKGKPNKKAERVRKICEILSINLPCKK